MEDSQIAKIIYEMFLSLLRFVAPVRPADPSMPPITDEEHRASERWEKSLTVPFVLFSAVMGGGWFLALKEAAELFPRPTPGTLFLVRPSVMFWIVPALILGVVTSVIPLGMMYRALLGERLARYKRSSDERTGVDMPRVFAVMTALVAAGGVLFFVAFVSSFTRFTENGVVISRPLSFRTAFHPYARVRSIEHRMSIVMSDGSKDERPHYIIGFDDGSSWSTLDGMHDPEPDVDGKIAALVSRRSGRPVVERP